MMAKVSLLLSAVVVTTYAAVISPALLLAQSKSQPTCGCTTTVTHYAAPELMPRQNCPSPSTITLIVAPSIATFVSGDPISIASSFAYASQIDSMKHEDSSQDRPTGEPPETTPIFYTHTALGPAVIGTDELTDTAILYHNIGTTVAPVATTTVSFPAEVTPVQRFNMTVPASSQSVTTITTYLSTTTIIVPNSATTSPPASLNASNPESGLKKRQTCSMVFAPIMGEWASWCNEWDGHTTVKHSTYETTVLMTHPHGASPIPSSVYAPSSSSPASVTIQTSPAVPMSSMPAPMPPVPESATTDSMVESSPITTSFVVTASVVVTYPITTVTKQAEPPASSSNTSTVPSPSVCGQVGQFVVTFDDLPTYSTGNSNDTTSPPIFNPYSHFFWSGEYGYAPPPDSPFLPSDGDRLAEYNPRYETPAPANAQGSDLPGSFGAGPRAFNSIFWFDAKSAFVGCNTTSTTEPCEILATGYRWIPTRTPSPSQYDGREQLAFTQLFTIPNNCAAGQKCNLTQISFEAAKFSNLSTLNLAAKVGGVKVGFYLDSFQAAWTNSTCAAGLERQNSRK